MAIATLTNTYSLPLNTPDVGGTGVSPDAVGGNVVRPLPFPFGANGAIAAGASKSLAVRERDLIVRQQPQQPSMPADDLNGLVQKGWLAFAVAADATTVDSEEEYLDNV